MNPERPKLIPGVSTHFIWTRDSIPSFTKGRVYKIFEWDGSFYSFFDNLGQRMDWIGQIGVEDCPFDRNLEEILK